jgi:hypothetical protein
MDEKDATKHLTGSGASDDSGSDVRALLEEAGLELWQAPEGFWAIRAKPAAPSGKPPRRRRVQRAA